MNKNQIIQETQEKVEKTVSKVKEALSQKSTQEVIKGAIGGAVIGYKRKTEILSESIKMT